MAESGETNNVETLIQNKLKPLVRKVDSEAYYAREYLTSLGRSGLLRSQDLPQHEVLSRELRLVEETAKTCMTTAFCLWCHLAALTYLRNSDNPFLKKEILPLLESGKQLGGTGLSNPMKFYAGLDSLYLKARKTAGGYKISGRLPSVSNLASGHGFGVIASVNDHRQIMAFVPCDVSGLRLKKKTEYLGVNGSATFACEFQDVYLSNDWIISENAADFVKKIRSYFVLYQIPLGLGVMDAAIQSMIKVRNKQAGCNQYLDIQPHLLNRDLVRQHDNTYRLARQPGIERQWRDLLKIRLDVAYLTIKAAHGNMLHHGAAGYLKDSEPCRRLREAYFFLNLTPTVKHLEKLLASSL